MLRLAPRALPRNLIVRLLFGDGLAVSGWWLAVLLVGITFLLARQKELSPEDYDRQATAWATKIEKTSTFYAQKPVYSVSYTFRDEAGTSHAGESFNTGAPVGRSWTVYYQSADPSVSQLDGMRRHKRPWTWLLMCFPILAVGIVCWELWIGVRNLRLLRRGAETSGKRVEVRESWGWSTFLDRSARATSFTFEYEVAGKTYTTKVKVKAKRAVVLNDDVREPMLYDPKRPSRATTLDHLPGSPRITADGDLEARAGTVIHLLILPVAFVALCVGLVSRLA